MKFNVSDLKKIINTKKKPRRNVVHKIGYDKFSPTEFIKDVRNYITSDETKRKVKDVGRAVKNLFKK